MFIACSKCGFSSEIPDNLLPEKGKARNVSCPRCSHTFLVSRDQGVTEISEELIEDAPIEEIEEFEEAEEMEGAEIPAEEPASPPPAREQPTPRTEPRARPEGSSPASGQRGAAVKPAAPETQQSAGPPPKRPQEAPPIKSREAQPKKPQGQPPKQPSGAPQKQAPAPNPAPKPESRPRPGSQTRERPQPAPANAKAPSAPPRPDPAQNRAPTAAPASQPGSTPTPARAPESRTSPPRPGAGAARENIPARSIPTMPSSVAYSSDNRRVFFIAMIIAALVLLPGYMIHTLVKNGKARNSWERYMNYVGVDNNPMELIAITEAIDRDGNNAEYYSARAATLNEMGAFNEAYLDAEEALKLDPSLNEAYYNRGMAKLGLGQYEFAKDDFEIVIGNDPVHAGAIHGRGEAYYMLEQYNQAMEDLEKACNMGIDEACDRVEELLEDREEPGPYSP